jgi:RNA polymerase sigma-70 factor (ECF subfamily)
MGKQGNNSSEDQTAREQEHRWVRAARGGDERAIRALVDAHKDRLYLFIWRMIRNHHDAEEICQESFLKAFANLRSFSTKYRFSTWLFTIAYRVCLNTMRRRKVQAIDMDPATLQFESPDHGDEAGQLDEDLRLKELIWSAVDQLSSPQKVALVLFYRHEQSCQEIAAVLDVPVATVKSHLHRARARLRDLLGPVSEDSLEALRNLAG